MSHATIALDADRRTSLDQWVEPCDGAVTIHPTDSSSIDECNLISHFRHLHQVTTRGLLQQTNVSDPLIFEFNYRDGECQFRFLSADDRLIDTDQGGIAGVRPFDTQPVPPTLVDPRPGQSLAACSFGFDSEHTWPLITDEQRAAVSAAALPAFPALIPDIAGEESELLVQIVARPAMRDADWLAERIATSVFDRFRSVPSLVGRDDAHQFDRDRDRPSYHLNVRLLGLARSPERADAIVDAAATQFSDQFARGILTPERVHAGNFEPFLDRVATRTWVDRSLRLTAHEFGWLCPLPHETDAPWTDALARADPPG